MEFVARSCYSGHKNSILDLTVSFTNQWIATTSDDHTIRLWDLKISCNAFKCFRGYAEAINMILFHPILDHMLIGSTDTSIVQFDTTLPGVVIQEFLPLYQTNSTAEITGFAIHPKDSALLAIGDDEGIISLYNIQSKSIVKRLSRIHSNLLGQIEFNPINPTFLVSGGFDGLLCIWDTRRGRPASNTINFNELTQKNESNLQIANPPFVHALLHIFNGRVIICALGDGHLSLYKTSDGSLLSVSDMVEAHGGMVTNLASYCALHSCEKDSFLTAGADGLIKIWDVYYTPINESPNTQKVDGKGKKNKKSSCPMEWYVVYERRQISHPNKINSLSSINLQEEGTGILVGDVTSDWCLYK